MSERCNDLIELCKSTKIVIHTAIKTFEYALCCSDNNIYYLIEAIKKEYKELGPKLEEKVTTKVERNGRIRHRVLKNRI